MDNPEDRSEIISSEEPVDATKLNSDGNKCLAIGTGVGVLGAAGAIIGGALCPLCVVVAPGIIGVGAYSKWKAKRLKKNCQE